MVRGQIISSSIVIVGIDAPVDLGAIIRGRVDSCTPVVRRRRGSDRGFLAAIEDSRRGPPAGPLYHRLILLIGQYVAVRVGR